MTAEEPKISLSFMDLAKLQTNAMVEVDHSHGIKEHFDGDVFTQLGSCTHINLSHSLEHTGISLRAYPKYIIINIKRHT